MRPSVTVRVFLQAAPIGDRGTGAPVKMRTASPLPANTFEGVAGGGDADELQFGARISAHPRVANA